MKKYISDYIQNTLLFFVISIIWNLIEGSPLIWLQMIIQALIFGAIITIAMSWLARRRMKKNSN